MNIENLKNFTKKLLELIDEFINVTDNKVDIQKTVAFLDTIKHRIGKWYLKVWFITAQSMKYVGLYLK